MRWLKKFWRALKAALGRPTPSLFVEFKVVDHTLMKLGGGDPLLQTKLRSEYLDAIRAKAEAADRAGQSYNEQWSPFPMWLERIIHAMASRYGTTARYEDENAIYALQLYGDRKTFEKFFAEFSSRFEAARIESPERLAWCDNHTVHPTATPDDENEALDALDAHEGGTQGLMKNVKKELAAAS